MSAAYVEAWIAADCAARSVPRPYGSRTGNHYPLFGSREDNNHIGLLRTQNPDQSPRIPTKKYTAPKSNDTLTPSLTISPA